MIHFKLTNIKTVESIAKHSVNIPKIWSLASSNRSTATLTQLFEVLHEQFQVTQEEFETFKQDILPNSETIKASEYFSNVHNYYYFDTHKNSNPVIKRISQLNRQELHDL